MQKKKFIITLLFAILSIFMITACSDSSDESNSGAGGTVHPEPEPDNLTVKKFYNFNLSSYDDYLSNYALLSDGSLYAWGNNRNGQLGLGDNTSKYYAYDDNQKINIPDKISELIGLEDVTYDKSNRITISKISLYAITENGELYAWGDNSDGQLGIGNTDNQTKPVKVTGITGKIKQLITFQHYHYGEAFFDYFSVYALTEDGSLYAWGYNSKGLLGVGDKMDRNTPTKVNLPGMVKEIMHNSNSVYTILEDGSLYAWDYNTPTPTKINLPGTIKELITNGNSDYAILEDGSLYSLVSINSTPTKVNLPGKVINQIGQFAILEDGSIYAWGDNYYGQLGIGSENDYVDTPTKVNLSGKIKELIYYSDSVYALLEDDTLYAWGDNYYGQLGLGSDEKKVSIPTKVNLPGKIKELILSQSSNGSLYAILEDGSLYAWGDNNYFGQLGVGSENEYVNTPTKVNLPGTIKELITIGDSVYAMLEDGSLYAWGFNPVGRLGIGSENEYVNTPNKVNLPGTIKELITNGNSVYAILEDNSLYAWGFNENGQLGIGYYEYIIYTPEQVTGIDGTIKYINMLAVSSYFLTENGLLYGAGFDYPYYPVKIEFKEK